MEAFHKLSQSSDTLSNAGTLPPPPLSTQTHWQKTTINKSKANTESKHKKSKALTDKKSELQLLPEIN